MKTFVVDSSTCLKWSIDDEIDSELAAELQKNYLTGKINLITPQLWLYEIINGLKSYSLKHPSVTSQSLASKLDQILESSPNLQNLYDLSSLCLKYSFYYKISGYDSAYITLAHANGLTLITSDLKLVSKINDPSLAISLKDYYNYTN